MEAEIAEPFLYYKDANHSFGKFGYDGNVIIAASPPFNNV
jgi:hypothetical protein